MLSDNALLEIFDFYVGEASREDPFTKKAIEAWQSLVHVCRRWRSVVFGSPLRLNLRLLCTAKTPARDTLDIWPALPLVIQREGDYPSESVDNVIAVLERSNRVCQIILMQIRSSHLEKALEAMQVPFPQLTRLRLDPYDETVPVLPDSFLGGSAPRLRLIRLDRISFPGLPKLLLSATHLVHLQLRGIPHSGYISPEVMATALSTLTSLESLWLIFESPRSRPNQANRRPSFLARSVLPVLTKFWFKGVCEYLDELMAPIDAPRLSLLSVTFFNQIVFETPQFIQFISRTPKFKEFERAHVGFADHGATVKLSSQTPGHRVLNVKIPCRDLDWQVSSLEQICTSCLPPLSMLENLYIYKAPYPAPDWQDNIEKTLWLELLHPFTTVKNLYLSEELAPRIVLALQELVGDRSTEVLPTLQNIFLEGLQLSGPIKEGIGQFVAARQVTSHHIAVSRWDNSWQDKFQDG